MASIRLPEFARINRELPTGLHPYLDVLPGVMHSPALNRITKDKAAQKALIDGARIHIAPVQGYAWIDTNTPAIVLSVGYYQHGPSLDLYMDLLHELTHIRQHHEGMDLWDDRYSYVDRITEIEGYAVAVEEGRRLGMTDRDVVRHLSNPWMTNADVNRLVKHIEQFLDGSLDHPELRG